MGVGEGCGGAELLFAALGYPRVPRTTSYIRVLGISQHM
jgi:hypothetical protein